MNKKEFLETQWIETFFELSDGKKFSIVHNIERQGNINSIQAAFDNWIIRTTKYTEKSLIDYINSKGVHKAMTKKNYDETKTFISKKIS
jgi:hypothetical protein